MKPASFILMLTCAATAQAATPGEMLGTYRTEAAREVAGFQPSAQRGRELYARRFGVSDKLPSCVACHTDNPLQAGRHAVTDKPIEALAPTANAERFTDKGKTEKWFRRNCKEVAGRECSAAEKADLLAYLTGDR